MYTECEQGRLRSKTSRRLAQKQLSSKECVTAHSPRLRAPKMDGTKCTADTTMDTEKFVFSGRLVSCAGRSVALRLRGPHTNKNPVKSNSIEW